MRLLLTLVLFSTAFPSYAIDLPLKDCQTIKKGWLEITASKKEYKKFGNIERTLYFLSPKVEQICDDLDAVVGKRGIRFNLKQTKAKYECVKCTNL